MTECRMLDESLITAFVDGELSSADHQHVAGHLKVCRACRVGVEAESAARHIVRAHAAVAKTMGVAPSWRPRAFRLGHPALAVSRSVVAAAIAAGGTVVVATVFILQSRPLEAIGVIGDSNCGPRHRYTAQVDAHTCTLNCVRRGAQFVLVSGTTVLRILNQDLPELERFADARVAITGTMGDEGITISRIVAAAE